MLPRHLLPQASADQNVDICTSPLPVFSLPIPSRQVRRHAAEVEKDRPFPVQISSVDGKLQKLALACRAIGLIGLNNSLCAIEQCTITTCYDVLCCKSKKSEVPH